MIFPNSGIIEQLISEHKASRILSINWDVKSFGSFKFGKSIFYKWDGIFCKWIGNYPGIIFFKKAYYDWILTEINENKYDILLLRFQPYDIFQYRFIKKNKKKIRIYLVLHTLSINELIHEVGIGSILKLRIEKFFGRLSIKEAFGVIGVTDEIANIEQNRAGVESRNYLIYPNGILFQDEKYNSNDTRLMNIPVLLFVAANFAPWHGLDLLLAELENSDESFILHLVGKVPNNFINQIKMDRRIIHHGSLSSLEIKSISAESWIGLSSFAYFRLNLNQGSTLKVREYLSNGLPVYASYSESFPDDFPFYKKGKCNIKIIIEFAKSMRKFSRLEVINASKPFIDKTFLLSKLYQNLQASYQD
jgi:hypothetical protein